MTVYVTVDSGGGTMDNAGLLSLGLALGVPYTLCIMWTGGRWQAMECGMNNELDLLGLTYTIRGSHCL